MKFSQKLGVWDLRNLVGTLREPMLLNKVLWNAFHADDGGGLEGTTQKTFTDHGFKMIMRSSLPLSVLRHNCHNVC